MSKTETIETSLLQSLEPISDTTSVSSSEINNKVSQKEKNKNNKNYKNKTKSNANLNSRKPKKEKKEKIHSDHLGISNQWGRGLFEEIRAYRIEEYCRS